MNRHFTSGNAGKVAHKDAQHHLGNGHLNYSKYVLKLISKTDHTKYVATEWCNWTLMYS